jgi:UDP-N-acetylmuramoyl-tripeptide--D-alanyl-D-alanine ligase
MKASLATCGHWVVGSRCTDDVVVDGLSIDSRIASAGSLFVALRGERFDSHTFLADVVKRGVAALVVEQDTDPVNISNLRRPDGSSIPMLIVPDSRRALGEIAHGWRREFSLPLIAVTGSNGKTTVKEMIAAILAAAVGSKLSLATQGNFNNEIGVPLTLIRLTADTRAAVIELGMNHPGEIACLTALTQPTVGLVNNAQREHQEFMESVAAVAAENGAVIDGLPLDGVAVFPAGDPFTPLWHRLAAMHGNRRVLTFGLTADADVWCTYSPNEFGSNMSVRSVDKEFTIKLAAAGEHNVRNALAAIACTYAIGVPVESIIRGLESFMPVAGRLQKKMATNGALVIDDTYNANPDSVRAAIDVLAGAAAPRILVLGDMGEVGDEGQAFHEEIGNYAKSRGIEHLLTLGDLATYSMRAFGAGGVHFGDIDRLKHAAALLAPKHSTMLVKGSRFMKMERVVQHLLGQTPQDSH